MKKKLIFYSAIAIVLVAVILLLITSPKQDTPVRRRINSAVTFKKEDKNPYGCFIAFNHLKSLFPAASVTPSPQVPGYWDSLSNYNDGQALVVVSPNFFASRFEMKILARFVSAGNTVIVSAENLSSEAEDALHVALNPSYFGTLPSPDSSAVSLSSPPFPAAGPFTYTGYNFQSWLETFNQAYVDSLGTDQDQHVNFVHLRVGRGHFYLHTAPLALTNYFLLQGNNLDYYENLFSLIPAGTHTIVWDEYYLEKKYGGSSDRSRSSYDNDNRGFLGELARYPAMLWFFLTIALGLLLYTFNEARRKQREIPIVKKPANDSLDFVKTIGRLYFDKGNHTNLARKMASYFLEYVRSKYKLSTSVLDDAFIDKLRYKSGVGGEELRAIVTTINRLDRGVTLTSTGLADFYKQLENFYKKA